MSRNTNAPAPEIPGVELGGVIGSGGSGVVYLGRQTAFGRDVAVKVASRGEASDESTLRWEREVAAIGRLSNHPNIVPVFDAGITEAGWPYLVMPYVPGGTLGDRIRDEGRMDPEEVASIGAKLAGTLATVHRAGVLHRDVKPDNVLWSPHGEPQLTDFGIARLRDLTTTLNGGLHATIAYAPPELLVGEPASEASDVYGLGATLYACLTGSAPHPTGGGESVAALVAKVLEEAPAPLSSTDVPRALAEVIDRSMARRPGERQSSATELRDDLEAAGIALAAPPDEPPAPPPIPDGSGDATAVVPAVDGPEDRPTAPQRRISVPAPVVGPAPRRAAPAPAATPDRPTRNTALWATMAGVLVLFLGLLAFGLTRGSDDDPETAAAVDTTEPEETASSEPPSTEPTTTEAPARPAETTAPPATTASDDDDDASDSDEGSSGSIGDAALVYIRTLDRGELDEAWSLATSRFQNAQDRQQWERFWGGFDDISVIGDLRIDEADGTVVLPLSLDGQREDYRLELVRQGGSWLVDGPVGR